MARKYPIQELIASFRSLWEIFDVLMAYQDQGNSSFSVTLREYDTTFHIVLAPKA